MDAYFDDLSGMAARRLKWVDVSYDITKRGSRRRAEVDWVRSNRERQGRGEGSRRGE